MNQNLKNIANEVLRLERAGRDILYNKSSTIKRSKRSRNDELDFYADKILNKIKISNRNVDWGYSYTLGFLDFSNHNWRIIGLRDESMFGSNTLEAKCSICGCIIGYTIDSNEKTFVEYIGKWENFQSCDEVLMNKALG